MRTTIRGLYVIVDPDACNGRSAVDVAARAIDGGASVIQWRDKRRPLGDQLGEATAIGALCARRGVTFIVNDHVDFAMAARADGVHLGQQDLPPEEARAIAGEGFVIGVSTNNAEEARRAEAAGADYVAVGAIFPTTTKGDTRAANLERITEVRAAVSVPVVAIGGINASNIESVAAHGADAAAVITAVCAAPDVRAAAAELAAAIGIRPHAGSRARMLDLMESYIGALNLRDVDEFVALFAEDAVLENPVSDEPAIGHEAIRRWWHGMRLSERPFAIEVQNVAVVGSEMALLWAIRHEHDGGQRALAIGVEILSVEDSGRIASARSLWNRTSTGPEERERTVAEAFVTAINNRDRDAFVALWADDGMRQDPFRRAPAIGIDAIAKNFDMMAVAYPDYSMGIDNICAVPGEVAIAWRTIERSGAGKRMVCGVDVLTLDANGKIAALHSYWEPDNLPEFE